METIQGTPIIGKEQIAKAEETLLRYKRGKANLDKRIIENEKWFRLRHWNVIKPEGKKEGDLEPVSAWLLNTITSKHADAMDNYPSPAVLPREASDKAAADVLSEVLPCVLQQNKYKKTYSDVWWYKLKHGTGVKGVFWDNTKLNGLGDVDIRKIDLLNLYWEPGITDIQKSRNLFHVELWDNDVLKEEYPQAKAQAGVSALMPERYIYEENIDVTDKSAVVDWYYKRRVGTKTVLHFCKFCNGVVLYSSEDDPEYAERGYYDHGLYPFVFDVLYPEEGSPAGFGLIDICKDPQLYIDKLSAGILKGAIMATTPRVLVRGDGKINEAEFSDWGNPIVHVSGSSADLRDDVMPLNAVALPDGYINLLDWKINEMKETSGSRDFNQGGTTSGVTAASAIAALMEAGNKQSRDMLGISYDADEQVYNLSIELFRQFYTDARSFRIVGQDGAEKFIAFDNAQIVSQQQGVAFGGGIAAKAPVFDIKVTAQKSSPFSTVAQNERAKELYSAGFFLPQNADQALAALDMMDFEGIEAVRKRISENGTMFQLMQTIIPQVLQMAAQLDKEHGTQLAQVFAMQFQQFAGGGANIGMQSAEGEVNSIGQLIGTTAGGARMQAARSATPQV